MGTLMTPDHGKCKRKKKHTHLRPSVPGILLYMSCCFFRRPSLLWMPLPVTITKSPGVGSQVSEKKNETLEMMDKKNTSSFSTSHVIQMETKTLKASRCSIFSISSAKCLTRSSTSHESEPWRQAHQKSK